MNRKFKRGFTLVEMMIVVAIIAVLAGVALPQYNKYIKKSKTVEGVNFMRQIADGEVVYRGMHGSYKEIEGTIAQNKTSIKDNLFIEIPASAKFANYTVATCAANNGLRIGATTSTTVIPGDDVNSIFMFIPPIAGKDGVYISNYVNEETGIPSCTAAE